MAADPLPTVKYCNCGYSLTLVRTCRYGTPIGNELRCNCTRDCAECVVYGASEHREGLPMHPDLYQERKTDIKVAAIKQKIFDMKSIADARRIKNSGCVPTLRTYKKAWNRV
jgi:hypothetical protein